MKQIIIAIFAIAMVSADPMDPECRPDKIPKNTSFVDCCQMKVEMVPKAVLDTCISKAPKPPPGGPPLDLMCGVECALKEVKVFVDGKIDKAVASALLSAKDPSLKATIEKGLDFCIDKISKINPENMKPPPGAPCSPIPMIASGCVYGQLYKECKSQLVPDKEGCKELSEFAEKCNYVPPCSKAS